MAASAQDIVPAPRHWAARPLPEPPRYKRQAKSIRGPLDHLGQQLEEWLRELPVGNTLDAE